MTVAHMSSGVSLLTLIAGEDLTNNVLVVEQRYSATQITTATTTVVKSGAGFLELLALGGGTSGTVTVYDNTAASGTVLYLLTGSGANQVVLHCPFSTGLTVLTSAATNISVRWR